MVAENDILKVTDMLLVLGVFKEINISVVFQRQDKKGGIVSVFE